MENEGNLGPTASQGMPAANREIDRLRAEVERLRQRAEKAEAACAKLRHFIKGHDWDCAKMVSARDEQPLEPCNCGFEELDKPNPGAPLLAYIAKLEAVRDAADEYVKLGQIWMVGGLFDKLKTALAAAKEAKRG